MSNRNIYYLVEIDEDKVIENSLIFYNTTCKKVFCGKILEVSKNKIYFELNGSKALVIISPDWIKSMAPSEKLWKERLKNRDE